MYGGYMGKLLFIDLASGNIREESPGKQFYEDYLGGYGIGIKVLYENMKPGVDPMGPENILGFLTGPLTGTRSIIGSRFMVVGKSPLTGGWGDANCGGHFGPAIKAAGYDGLFVSGVSDKPSYILLDNGKVEIRDASMLWGKDTHVTDAMLKSITGTSAQVACIGPAGEKCSLISAVITDGGRAAARSGLGAVMGSKKLKAIVAVGDKKVPVADEKTLDETRKKYMPALKEGFAQLLSDLGTPGLLDGAVETGDAPVKNWAGVGVVDFPEYEKIGGAAVKSLEVKKYGCSGCPVVCGGWLKFRDRNGQEKLTHKVEYETIGAFGPMCLNNDLLSIIEASDICNMYGLDTISAGGCVAFAIECFENGLLSLEDTGGLELKWGNSKAIVELTEKIARREGVGELLADGVKLAAEKIGGNADEYAIHIGGQEAPMHDPRFTPGILTTYVTDPTPGRHTQGIDEYPPPGLELQGFKPDEQKGRGQVHKYLGDLQHVMNGAGLCLFSFFSVDVQSIPEFLNAVTGWNRSLDDLMVVGERISQMRHVFNLREGIKFTDLPVPKRLQGIPPLAEGPTAGCSLDLDTLQYDYIRAMGWDEKTLVPSRERLEAVGLEEVLKDFYS